MAEAVSEKSRGLSFAEQQMLRHGWQPGKGLGRLEDGMSEPIKVKVKCDKGGVGHKLGDQFTFNWWDHVFNKASSNLSVESGQDGIMMKKINDEEEEGMISNKRPLKAKLSKGMQYGCFVKSATLLSGEEQPEQRASGSDDSSDSEDDDQKLDLSSANNLSDAELLKICGGRTAHKGARHGLTMSAKLARLEQQEQDFMAKYGKRTAPAAPPPRPVTPPASQSPSEDGDVSKKTKRKKEKKKRSEAEEVRDTVTNGEITETPDIPDGERKEKRKKKKSSKEEVDSSAENTPVEAPVEDQKTDDSQLKKKKKKKKKNRSRHQEMCEEDVEHVVTTASTEEPVADHLSSTNVDCQKTSKKKRPKKGLANGLDSVVNGHDADGANECGEASEVVAAGVEEFAVEEQACVNVDSRKAKKERRKKSSKTKEDMPTLDHEGETQNEGPREEWPNGTDGEERADGQERTDGQERADGKDKAKKRKAAALNDTEFNDGDTSMKKRKKRKRKD